MAQLENIEAIEKRLWSAADTLRANSNYASNEYFMPVMGLIFLRHAYSRYLAVKDEIEANLPTRGGKTRPLTKEDFSQKRAIFLRSKAQFDSLVSFRIGTTGPRPSSRPWSPSRPTTRPCAGCCPRANIRNWTTTCWGSCCAPSIPEELKKATGDIFGRIYEYFLTQFADQKAHDGGEFFTPDFAGFADRQCDRAGARHRPRPGLRLGRHVCAERPFRRSSCRRIQPSAHLLRPGEERRPPSGWPR